MFKFDVMWWWNFLCLPFFRITSHKNIIVISTLIHFNFMEASCKFILWLQWNLCFIEKFLRCLIFLNHGGKTGNLPDQHQGNAVLISFLIQYHNQWNYTIKNVNILHYYKSLYSIKFNALHFLKKFHQILESFGMPLSFHNDIQTFILIFKVSRFRLEDIDLYHESTICWDFEIYEKILTNLSTFR